MFTNFDLSNQDAPDEFLDFLIEYQIDREKAVRSCRLQFFAERNPIDSTGISNLASGFNYAVQYSVWSKKKVMMVVDGLVWPDKSAKKAFVFNANCWHEPGKQISTHT